MLRKMCTFGMIKGKYKMGPSASLSTESLNRGDADLRAIWEFFPFVFRINDNLSPNKGTSLTVLEAVCKERGWKEFGDNDGKIAGGNMLGWNLWWRSVVMVHAQNRSLYSWQYTNHIPRAINFCNKEYLASYIRIMEENFGKIYKFCPKTFTLPKELEEFEHEHNFRCKMGMLDKLAHHAKNLVRSSGGHGDEPSLTSSGNPEGKSIYNPVWICKPLGKSQGKGIVVINNLTNLPDHPVTIVQEYISKPLLISGYKFDLRLYVTIVSVSPLTIYAYREGLTRFATEHYDLSDLEKNYSHLTNASLNKLSPGYSLDKEGVGQGCKWTLQKLRRYFLESGKTDWFLWQKIMSIIVLTILGETIQQVGIPWSRNSFEFLGYDILIDRDMRPWLLETNLSPGLGGDCKVDEIVKKPMLHELFDLLGLPDKRPLVTLVPASEIKNTENADQILEVDERSNTALKLTEAVTDLTNKGLGLGSECSVTPATNTASENLETAILKKMEHRISKVKLSAHGKISPSLRKRLLDVTSIYGHKLVKKKFPGREVFTEGSETSPEAAARLNFIASTDWQGITSANKLGGDGNSKSVMHHAPGIGLKRRCWYDAPARQGDWIRIFPFDFLSFQMSRGHLNMDMKVIVAQVDRFLKLAQTLCREDPNQVDEYYCHKLREEISWNKVFWLPPEDIKD